MFQGAYTLCCEVDVPITWSNVKHFSSVFLRRSELCAFPVQPHSTHPLARSTVQLPYFPSGVTTVVSGISRAPSGGYIHINACLCVRVRLQPSSLLVRPSLPREDEVGSNVRTRVCGAGNTLDIDIIGIGNHRRVRAVCNLLWPQSNGDLLKNSPPRTRI